MTSRNLLLLSFLALPIHHLAAQSIQNVKATFQDGKAIIVYDLTGGRASQKYSLELFSSHNNFSTPLARLSGDFGKSTAGGMGKKIIWNAAEELGEYHGDITFRVKGSLIIAPFAFTTPAEGSSMRRGKKANLAWDGGSPSQNVKLELFKGTERISAVTETQNSGQYTWSVPKGLTKGSYTLKLTAEKESVTSKPFTVKSKMPLLLKIIPFVAVGGVVAALGGGSKGEGAASDLPAAPGPK